MNVKSILTLGIAAAMMSVASAETALRANVDVNVRTGPGTGYAVMGVARAGQGYAGISSSNGWWKICWDGRTGWTSGSLWSVVGGQSGVKVAVSTANVRSGPGTGYAIVGHAYAGQVYRYDSYNGWYRIWFGGAQRWIAGSIVARVSLAGGTPPPPPPPPPATSLPTNLDVPFYKQETGYWCVVASSQMTIRYLSGKYYYQSYLARWLGTTTAGTLNSKSVDAIRAFTGQPYYYWLGFSRDKIIYNINRSKPVPLPFYAHLMPYSPGIYGGHYGVLKGYTSGGFYIHDAWWGPRWVTSATMYNASVYNPYGREALAVRY